MIRKFWMIVRGAQLLFALVLACPVEAAFTVNSDGTVTDGATGLIWDQCSWGSSGTTCSVGASSTYTQPLALAVAVTANSVNYKGHTDWRLPNRNELESLADLSRANPAIDTITFPNTSINGYWSSTTYPANPGRAGVVYFDSGDVGAWFKTSFYYVRLVRRGLLLNAFDAQAPWSPGNVVAVLGNAKATVTFSAPGGGGAVVSGYTVRATAYGGGAGLRAVQRNSAAVTEPVATDIDAGSLSLNHTVTGLVNGTAYTFSVIAHSSEGDSLESLQSDPIVPAASTGTLITRYRLYSDGTKEHLYTTDPHEYSVLPVCCSWLAEGAIYKLFQGAGSLAGVDAVQYYRLYNPFSHQHHWTTDQYEYNVLGTMGWSKEGVDGYILPTAVVGSVPLYRLYLNAFGGLHLWTTDDYEKNVLSTSQGWVDEGVAGWVVPLP